MFFVLRAARQSSRLRSISPSQNSPLASGSATRLAHVKRRFISQTRSNGAAAAQRSSYLPQLIYFQCGELVNEKYRVLRFSGGGQFGFTYLVHDTIEDRFATLKIATPFWIQQKNKLGNEAEMFHHVHTARVDHPGYNYVASTLFDTFTLESPEGPRTCWVTPVYGPTVQDISITNGAPKSVGLRYGFIKVSTRKLLLALSYLHDECNVVHGAVDETNIVLDTADQDPFMNQNSPDYYAPHTEWGNPLKPVSWRYPEHDDLPVRLLDFSYARHASRSYDGDLQTWPFHRAPEVYLRAGWSTSSDIWNLGVSLYSNITGVNLIAERRVPAHVSMEFDVVVQMYQLFGEFPQNMLQKGTRTSEWFWPDGNMKTSRTPPRFSLVERLRNDRRLVESVIPLHEEALVADFLLQMLRLDPAERATATGLLSHPWLMPPFH